jgi:hypothetical protein
MKIETLLQMERFFILIVSLENHQFEYYITEPKIFYSNYQEAKEVQDSLIEKKELSSRQIKIQTVWKVNT